MNETLQTVRQTAGASEPLLLAARLLLWPALFCRSQRLHPTSSLSSSPPPLSRSRFVSLHCYVCLVSVQSLRARHALSPDVPKQIKQVNKNESCSEPSLVQRVSEYERGATKRYAPKRKWESEKENSV